MRDAAFEKMRQRYADAGMDFCFPPDLRQPAWSIAEWVFDVSWQAATEAERERCAKIADEYIADDWGDCADECYINIAAAIRAGKEQKDG